MKENNKLEFKESITNTFLKTVSAYANYNGGEIVFGIDDNGKVKGLMDLEEARLSIENKINDSISPQPEYTISVNERDSLITLNVKSGENKPYLYKSKAYKRNDTATIGVDNLELSRLILEGKNINFEDIAATSQDFSFDVLENLLISHVGISSLNKDILKTLNLFSDLKGYNNAAAILADENDFPGIDIVKFGENINIMQKRKLLEGKSILKSYEEAIELYTDYYQYEEIVGSERKTIEVIPEAAFRETLANAIIHRTWDVNAKIRVMMFDDGIEVVSPGGLPTGISESEYLSGKISMLRNPILAQIFYRLNIVEIFGTGILRIKNLYNTSITKPQFEVSENAIKVFLPKIDVQGNLTDDEKKVYSLLSKTMHKSISEITPYVEFGKSKVTVLLKSMADKGVVSIEGKGRGTKYHL